MVDNPPAPEDVLPCPFCGGGETQIDEKLMSPTMDGKRSVISASVRHWCPKREGQPHGLSVSMIGRDRESAIAAWNTRTPAIADGVGVEAKRVAAALDILKWLALPHDVDTSSKQKADYWANQFQVARAKAIAFLNTTPPQAATDEG